MYGKQSLSSGNAASPEEAHLQQLSHTFLDLLYSQKDDSHPFFKKHLALEFARRNDFNNQITRLPQKASKSNHHQQMDIVPDMDKSGSKATVWCWRQDGGVTGDPTGLQQESVTTLHWEVREKVWICVKMATMTGLVGF